MKIIIADDSPLFLNAMESALRGYMDTLGEGSNGHTIYRCSDGIEALEVYEKEGPDCIFSDVRMPRMNGFELLRRMQGDPDVEKILVSSYAYLPEYQAAAAKLGASIIDKEDSAAINGAIAACFRESRHK